MIQLHRIRSAAIVAPHPDDEIIGTFGLATMLRNAGTRVYVIVVTDGAGSHPNLRGRRIDQLVAARRKETISALRRIGVFKQDIEFLKLPDRALGRERGIHVRAIRRAIERRCPLGLLLLPTAHDAHGDHRFCARAAERAQTGRTPRMGYTVWPERRTGPSRLILKLGPLRLRKRQAIQSYRSQTGYNQIFPDGFRLRRSDINRFSAPLEKYEMLR